MLLTSVKPTSIQGHTNMKKGFTFIEMIFVIVIMGILAKFGAEIFRNVYQNYTNSTANNKLQVDTELTLQQIANRLQYRIKDSVIAKRSNGLFTGLSSVADTNYTTLAWIGYDIDGWLGDANSTAPTWSGFIDLNTVNTVAPVIARTDLFSPETNATRINTVFTALGPSNPTIANAAIFFTGENVDTTTSFGWRAAAGAALNTQFNIAAHRIQDGGPNLLADATGTGFGGTEVYEQYKMAWTAYALEVVDGNLTLYYDFRPWEGDIYTKKKQFFKTILWRKKRDSNVNCHRFFTYYRSTYGDNG